MSTFEVYLWVKLDAIANITIAFSVIGIFLTALINVFIFNESSEILHIKKSIAICIFLFLILITGMMIPTTKQAAVVYVMPKIFTENNVEILSEDAKEIYEMGIKTIKENLKQEEKTLDN